MFLVIKELITIWNYLFIFIATTLVVFVIIVLSSSFPLVVSVLFTFDADVLTKFYIIVGMVGSIQTKFSGFSIFSIITVSILFGANISAITYLIKNSGAVLYRKSIVGAGGGAVSAILGGGCATCGTLVVAPLLASVGLGGLLSLLPFGGQEFNVLALVVLLLSFWNTLKKIKTMKVKKVCSV